MIKFFRTIRRRLLRENRFTRYLFYAVGEIILVVIGILIALQINNQNEFRKERRLENEMLNGFASDFRTDSLNLVNLIEEYKADRKHGDSILQMLFESEPYDSLKFLEWNLYVFAFEDYFQPSRGTYDESESSGRIQYIQNKVLRRKLYDYYSRLNSATVDKINKEMNFDRAFPYFFELFGASKEVFLTKGKDYDLPPIDINKFKNDKSYVSRLVEKSTMHLYQLNEYEDMQEKISELLVLIEKELKD